MSRRSRCAAVLALLLVVGSTARGSDSAPPKSLSVVTYNIRHGAGADGKVDLRRIADVLSAEQPDLVALQEIDRNCTRSGKIDIAKELGMLLGMHHRFAKFMDFQGGEYGMAVLSRLPIRKAVRHPLPEGAEPRCALEIEVEVEGIDKPLSLLCIHNDWTSEEIRVDQVKSLIEQLGERERPTILAGDFNGARSDLSVKLLAEAGFSIVGAVGNMTWPADEPEVEIDFIMERGLPAFSATHEVIEETMASDHRPVAATFEFVPATPGNP